MKSCCYMLVFLLLGVFFASCKEKNDQYYVPTINVEVRGGSSGQVNSAIGGSGSSYTPYQGRYYMGEEGQPSSGSNNYNYYRGQAD